MKMIFGIFIFAAVQSWAQTPPSPTTPQDLSAEEVQGTIAAPTKKQKKSMKSLAKKARKNAKSEPETETAPAELKK